MHLNTAYLTCDMDTSRDRSFTVLFEGVEQQIRFTRKWEDRSMIAGYALIPHAVISFEEKSMPPVEIIQLGGYWRHGLEPIRFANAPVNLPFRSGYYTIEERWDLWRFEAECRIRFGAMASQIPGRAMHEFYLRNHITGIQYLRDGQDRSSVYELFSEVRGGVEVAIKHRTGDILSIEEKAGME